jgi:hypothetical protein
MKLEWAREEYSLLQLRERRGLAWFKVLIKRERGGEELRKEDDLFPERRRIL